MPLQSKQTDQETASESWVNKQQDLDRSDSGSSEKKKKFRNFSIGEGGQSLKDISKKLKSHRVGGL